MRATGAKAHIRGSERPPRLVATLCICLVGLACWCSIASAAPETGSLEESCIAAGTVLPTEMRGFMFNHHPEKNREPRASDHYQTVLETVAEFQGVLPRISDECNGHFRQMVYAKAQYQATKSPSRWLSLERRWENLPLGTQEFLGDPPWLSSFSYFQGQQNINTFGRGCTVRGRVRFKFEVLDKENGAVVAIRYADVPLQVDSWFEARCLGTFSIHESSGAHRCGQVVGTRPFGRATLWGVKVRGVACATAKTVAGHALEVPAFLEGSLHEQRLNGWRCFYGHRGAASCSRGAGHIFLVARGEAASRCDAAPHGVRALAVAGVDCSAGGELVEALRTDPTTDTDLLRSVATGTWSCPANRTLGKEDRVTASYECVAGGRVVSFDLIAPKAARVVPVPPSSIPAEVRLPPPGDLGFPRTPLLRFGYQKTMHGKLLLPLEVDPALVGRHARLQIKTGTMKCEWTADPGEDVPSCGPTHWRGRPRSRKVTLHAKQLVAVGPSRHRGNWAYEAKIKTAAFKVAGLPYTKAVGDGWAGVINHASNCSASPWCHPHHRRARFRKEAAYSTCRSIAIDYTPTPGEHYSRMYIKAPPSIHCPRARSHMRRHRDDHRPCDDSSCNRVLGFVKSKIKGPRPVQPTLPMTGDTARSRSEYVTCRSPSFHLPGNRLSARGTSCRTARRVISAFFAKAQARGPNVHVRGFWCVDDPSGKEPVVRCRRGRARVHYRGEQG